jgi:hypothetical protein
MKDYFLFGLFLETKSMEKGEHWMPVLVASCILSPMALVHYSDVFLVLDNSLIAFPWFCYSLRFRTILGYGYDLYTPYGTILVVLGIIWFLLGLSLVPILKTGLREFQWLTMTIVILSVLLLQSIIVQYGFSLTIYEYFYITIIPLPVPSLVSLAIIVVKSAQRQAAKQNGLSI